MSHGRSRGRRPGRGLGGQPIVGRQAAQALPDEYTWKKINVGDQQTLKDILLTEVEGLNCRVRDDATVLDYVELYLTDAIMTLIVDETNRFAEQYLLEKSVTDPDNSYLGQWTPVTIPEMKKFIGTLLLMGIVYKPDLHMYWSTDIYYSTPAFSKIMKRDRFYLILKFLHFNNNETVDPENPHRLHKVRPLIQLLRERFRKVYSPGKNMSVDESVVLYKGRLKFKQYIKPKRQRLGTKLYELCTSSGITLDFLVCCQGMYSDDDLYSKMPPSEHIPLVLMEPFLGKGHVLYTDNFYTSPLLAKHFSSKDTHLCGKIKKNRKNVCTDIVTEQLYKRTAVFYKCKETEMVAVK